MTPKSNARVADAIIAMQEALHAAPSQLARLTLLRRACAKLDAAIALHEAENLPAAIRIRRLYGDMLRAEEAKVKEVA
jgi:hypothetical protein